MAGGLFGFDLETTELAPDRASGELPPVACAAIAHPDGGRELLHLPAEAPQAYELGAAGGALTATGAAAVVHRLGELVAEGGILVTWNGAGFDLPVLARASGLHGECAQLALSSVDMMFQVLASKGWPLKLAAALEGMGLPGKTGDGVEAVDWWRAGRHAEVLDYCAADAARTCTLAAAAAQAGELRWRSSRGAPQRLALRRGWLTVRECLALPLPDTSWMDNPLTREALVGWAEPGGAV